MGYYAGVDLGATNLRAVIADDDGEIRHTARTATPVAFTGIDVTEAVLDVIREACDGAGVQPTDVVACGIASVGPLDLAEGAVIDPANFPDQIDRIPLRGPVRELIESPKVYLHNDASAGVIGERYFGEANPDDMVYLTISTGIGAGAAVDGHVLHGWDGNAGEIGHMVVDPLGRLTCGCGKPGHWEAYCAGGNIPSYARLLAEDDPSAETTLDLDDPGLTAADVFAAAHDDAFAAHVVDQVAHWNAIGVANIVHAYAPIVVRFGGAVALNNPRHVLDPIRERIDEYVMTNVPSLELTALGEDVVVKGALASALMGGSGDSSHLR